MRFTRPRFLRHRLGRRGAAFVTTIIAGGVLALTGCDRKIYVPERATGAYPTDRHAVVQTTEAGEQRVPLVADVQVFPGDTDITLVNATATSFNDVTVWLNQRYSTPLPSLPAGGTVSLSLWEFFDQWGQRFQAGGFWRTYDATPVNLVEIETGAGQPLVGLITIPKAD